VTQREHLEQVEKMLGEAPPELISPDFPDVAAHLWAAFLDIHKGRSYGMSGGNPRSWSDIAAWCNLTGIVLSSWDVETIKALDMAWVRSSNEDKG